MPIHILPDPSKKSFFSSSVNGAMGIGQCKSYNEARQMAAASKSNLLIPMITLLERVEKLEKRIAELEDTKTCDGEPSDGS